MASRIIADMLQGIELKEQQLIQQIRTSGIRKQRETALIDEILEIRKDRRQLCSLLSSAISDIQLNLSRAENNACEARDNTKLLEKQFQQKLEQKNLEIDNMKEQQKSYAQSLSDQHARQMKDEKRRIAAKYEEKLQLIEERLNEVQEAKNANESVKAKADAAIFADIEQQYSLRIEKYKEALGALAEREKDLKLAFKKKQSQCDILQDELRTLSMKYQQLELEANREKQHYTELDSKMKSQQHSLENIQEEKRVLEVRCLEYKTRLATELTSISKQHEMELQRIDQRVRSLIQSKDKQIQALQQQINDSESASTEVESLLRELNVKL